jgi:DNA invertase Pin-like site-specific DNA recombinase
MIGESVPDQHKQVIAHLSAQIEHYLATGHRIELVPAGKSGEIPFTAIGNHPKNLKARRDKHEPRVRELAAAGNTASAIATAVGIDSRTVRRIAKEHSITLAEPT